MSSAARFAAIIMMLSLLCPSVDAQQHESARMQFDVESQQLSDAINAWAQQAGLQVVWPAGNPVASSISPRLVGQYDPQEALHLLLQGSGLTYSFADSQTVAIHFGSEPDLTNTLSEPSAILRVSTGTTNSVSASGERKTNPVAADLQEPRADGELNEPTKKLIDEVIVTGSHIRGSAPVGSALIVLDRKEIDRTGYATVQDVVQTLPQNFAGSQSETTQSIGSALDNSAYGSSVNLRGLGADATLTLINGRRLAPAGLGSFVDISAIPLTLVERIEVVPDGASATYGSDAVGGVVNMILRQDYQGAQTNLRYGALTGGEAPETQLGQVFGKSWEHGNVLLGYEYYKRDSLAASAREFTANTDLRPLGGSNFSSLQSNPGNITRIGVSNVNLAVPHGQDGTALSEGQLSSGQQNFQNVRESTDILPRQERHSVVVSASQALGERWKIFADALYSDRDYEIADNRPGTDLQIPESNAYRQLNNLFPGRGPITMAYDFDSDLGAVESFGKAKAINITTGSSVQIGGSWQAELSATYADVHEDSEAQNLVTSLDIGALNSALASSNRETAFNPFADGSNTNANVLAGLTGSLAQRSRTLVRALNVKADGSLLDLPAGSVKLAVGAELRHERFSFASTTVTNAGLEVQTPGTETIRPGARTARAAFAEVYLPIFSSANQRSWVHLLDLSLSARYENYGGFGDTTNPKIGARWSAIDGLTLRGTYGTSFKAPLLRDINRPSRGFVIPVPSAFDPLATNGSTITLLTSGGKSDLDPETAQTWTLGLLYAPPKLEGFQLDLNYFNVDLNHRISDPGSLVPIFAHPELYPGVLLRNPTQAEIDSVLGALNVVPSPAAAPGTIEAIADARLRNLAIIRVDGIDLDARYRVDSQLGEFGLSINASYLLSFDEQFSSAAPIVQSLDTIGKPVDLRLRGGLAWLRGPFGVSGFINYVDKYRDNLSVPIRKISSWVTADFQARYVADESRSDWLSGISLSISVTNLFDRDPPFANNSLGAIGFDPANSSPLGRLIALDVSKKW